MNMLLRSGLTLMVSVSSLSLGFLPAMAKDQPIDKSQESSQSVGAKVPCAKQIKTYLYPTAPKYYQCCVPLPELEVEKKFDDNSSAKDQEPRQMESNTRISVKGRNPHVLARGFEQSCVNLSDLTPLEALLRSKQPTLQDCGANFVVYDHFMCECQNACTDSTWQCNCPGVAPGELPEIKPQDSLRSQVELLGTISIPCNIHSTCE